MQPFSAMRTLAIEVTRFADRTLDVPPGMEAFDSLLENACAAELPPTSHDENHRQDLRERLVSAARAPQAAAAAVSAWARADVPERVEAPGPQR